MQIVWYFLTTWDKWPKKKKKTIIATSLGLEILRFWPAGYKYYYGFTTILTVVFVAFIKQQKTHFTFADKSFSSRNW